VRTYENCHGFQVLRFSFFVPTLEFKDWFCGEFTTIVCLMTLSVIALGEKRYSSLLIEDTVFGVMTLASD